MILPGLLLLIEEPTGEVFTDYAAIDFIAVPGVAFDRKGNRLGRGKGYYDRLLPRIPSACKAGICFPFQLVEEVPAESFDIRSSRSSPTTTGSNIRFSLLHFLINVCVSTSSPREW